MPNKNLIITLMSDDKPGIVSQVAQIIASHDANWLDSHLVQLAGKFTGLLRVDVPQDKIASLTTALESLKDNGIATLIEHETLINDANLKKMQFELSGPDRTGIVSEIATAFNTANVSIDKIQTHCSSSPWSGEPLFEANGELLAPLTLSNDDLTETLNTIEDALGINITITETI